MSFARQTTSSRRSLTVCRASSTAGKRPCDGDTLLTCIATPGRATLGQGGERQLPSSEAHQPRGVATVVAYAVDIEPTNRCNAKCHFCPRDMSPHEGLMALEVFEQALARVIEYREHSIAVAGYSDFDWISLCGEGEPLLNKNTPTFVRMIRDAGLKPHMASNGSLLDERRTDALLEGGLWRIALNVGETGDDYERVYKLPWEKTRDNVLRFIEVASDQVEIYLVLVDHRRDPDHIQRMAEFWRSHGVDKFLKYNLTNRGGSLFLDHMQFDEYAERADALARYDALENKPM